MKSLLWFEPEHVTPGTWLWEHHPEWLLAAPPNPGSQRYEKDWRLLNFGLPEARRWMTDRIDHVITSEGIDIYREDFNLDPLYFWRAHDAPDRQGMTENKYVCGYLENWSELQRRHPRLRFDSCASGGQRLDLETMRRAIPRWRSDYGFEPVAQQGQTYGLALWLPCFGAAIVDEGTYLHQRKTHGAGFCHFSAASFDTAYLFRSVFSPSLISDCDVRRGELDYIRLRKLFGEWRRYAPCRLGDYYPLGCRRKIGS